MEPFTLKPLPWNQTSLEPHISAETIDFHYGKHHRGYVTKLNAAVKMDPSLASKSLEDLIVSSPKGNIFNSAAQTWNHDFYWNSISPHGGGKPSGRLADHINASFGSFENFKKEFSSCAAGHFGSGWAWLVLDAKDKKLKVVGTHDAENPLRDGGHIPILTCDVWEHAYYIDYRNDRGKYIESWWNIVHWDFAERNLSSLAKM